MAHNWKVMIKHAGVTSAEVVVLTGAIVLTRKFIDARTFFAKEIAADPTYADKWYVKHQGFVKIGIGLAGAIYFKNPWVKMLFIGLAVEGGITESVALSTNKTTGVSFFEKIGATQQQIDDEMLAASNAVHGMSGYGNQYGSQVAGGMGGYGNQYGSQVAGGMGAMTNIDWGTSAVTGVAGVGSMYG